MCNYIQRITPKINKFPKINVCLLVVKMKTQVQIQGGSHSGESGRQINT